MRDRKTLERPLGRMLARLLRYEIRFRNDCSDRTQARRVRIQLLVNYDPLIDNRAR